MTTTPDNAQSRKPWWNRPVGGFGIAKTILSIALMFFGL